MLTYAIVLLVVLAVLYGSFRVLGGGHEPVGVEDYRQLLQRLSAHTAERAEAGVEEDDDDEDDEEVGQQHRGPVATAPRGARRPTCSGR